MTWTRLRQVALVVHDRDAIVDELRRRLGIEVAFEDPAVATFGLRNAVLPVGTQFVEVVTPIREATAGGRQLARLGGDGGYMVICHTDDHDRRHARVGEFGVRVAFAAEDHDHFWPHGKDQLATEVIEESGAAYLQLFELFAAATPDIADALVEFFEGGAALLEETEFVDPCPIGTVAREVASMNEPLRQATDRVFRSWIDAATVRFVDAGMPPPDAAELATTLVAIIEGGFVLSRSARDAAPLRACARQADRLVRSALSAGRV